MDSEQLAHLRQDYSQAALSRADMAACPLEQFKCWFSQAQECGVVEPNAMILATVDEEGCPNSRVVLLKDLEAGRFTFFTNYLSEKARELSHGRQAASLTFFWKELERQIQIRGAVARVSAAESDAYFAKRPYRSQIGAWASAQSAPLAGRSALEESFAAFSREYPEGSPVPRPPHWGGFALLPASLEFWQGRRSRLHDRFRYTRQDAGWLLERRAP